MSKLISTFKIGFDDETKADIAALKSSLDTVSNGLKAGTFIPTGGLLAAMVGEAANDADELLELGQWVFKGCDPKIQSASVDSDGEAVRWSCDKKELDLFEGQFVSPARVFAEVIKGKFNAKNWRNSAINRQPVNDVDYLSETTPEIQGMEANEIIIDEMGRDYSHNSNCLHAVVPQITQADMQHIFIKNLSEVLIQRMYSMGRFGEDDHYVGGENLLPWDIVIGQAYNKELFCVVFAQQHSSKEHFNKVDVIVLEPKGSHGMIAGLANIYFTNNDTYRTIREDELPAFRAALEACYA